jgi:hypothetical protein
MLCSKRYNVKNFSELVIPLNLLSFPSFTLLIHLKVLQVSQLNHLDVHWVDEQYYKNGPTFFTLQHQIFCAWCGVRYPWTVSSLCDYGMDHGRSSFNILLCYFACGGLTIPLWFPLYWFCAHLNITNCLLWLTTVNMAGVCLCFGGKQ